MTAAAHHENLGKLVANLQSLEFVLRGYLFEKGAQPHNPMPGTKLDQLKVGDIVPENAMTNFDTLGALIRRYNALEPSEQVDPEIADLRNAIAHGRVSAPFPSTPYRLLKFSRPKKGETTVVYSAEMTSEWFAMHIKRVATLVARIARHLQG